MDQLETKNMWHHDFFQGRWCTVTSPRSLKGLSKHIGRHRHAIMGCVHEVPRAPARCKTEGRHRHAPPPSPGTDVCKVGGRHRHAPSVMRKKSASQEGIVITSSGSATLCGGLSAPYSSSNPPSSPSSSHSASQS